MVERIEQLEVPLAHVIPEMTSNLLVPIAIIIYLFILDWRMALVSLITIPVGMMCYMGMMKEYPKKYGEVVKAGNHMSATTVEYIGGIEVIKAFNQADNSYQKFTDAVHANADLILDWITSIYAHILDEDRKVNAQKFETAFYAKPDLRNVRPPEEPAKSEPATLDLENLVEQLQKSPELASALAALIAAQAPAK